MALRGPAIGEDVAPFIPHRISLERAEHIAAHMRARGRPLMTAWEEWTRLPEADREFWLSDVYAVLARVNIEVDRTLKDST